MRFKVLATDYDSTLAREGHVHEQTVHALRRLLESGRKLVMVSGRELEELLSIFPEIGLFEWIVAENGALLYHPSKRQEKRLADPIPAPFLETLRQRNITPLSCGRVIVATREPNEVAVLQIIRDLGLELQVIFNKGAVMVLPTGITKATGLNAALLHMGLSRHNAVGIGDAENDHHFLHICECSAAVANALPAVKDRVDLVTSKPYGEGVVELIDRLIKNDLLDVSERLTRHHIELGDGDVGRKFTIPPYGVSMLITGATASGKSRFAAFVLQRLAEADYQYCVVDMAGEYPPTKHAVILGSSGLCPALDDVSQLFASPEQSGIVNLSGLPAADRPAYFESLMARLEQLRTRTGRPHWIVVDQAHEALPADRQNLPRPLNGMVYITAHPEKMAEKVRASISLTVVVGEKTRPSILKITHTELPFAGDPDMKLPGGEAIVWPTKGEPNPTRIRFPTTSGQQL